MSFLVATNVVASRPPERWPTGTPQARANFLMAYTKSATVNSPLPSFSPPLWPRYDLVNLASLFCLYEILYALLILWPWDSLYYAQLSQGEIVKIAGQGIGMIMIN